MTPFRLKRVGVVITGNEVYYGRIQDGFGPVLREKFAALGCEIIGVEYAPDDRSVIVDKILSFAQAARR